MVLFLRLKTVSFQPSFMPLFSKYILRLSYPVVGSVLVTGDTGMNKKWL